MKKTVMALAVILVVLLVCGKASFAIGAAQVGRYNGSGAGDYGSAAIDNFLDA